MFKYHFVLNMKSKNKTKYYYITFLLMFCQFIVGQEINYADIGRDFNKMINETLKERENRKLYYENLKNQSLNNIYAATDANNYQCFAIKKMFYDGQQEFVQTINNSYKLLTNGRLKPNEFESNISSYNSQFLNFKNTLLMISNSVNDMVTRGKNLSDIEQKINSVYNSSNMNFIIYPYEIQLKYQSYQTITFNVLVNDIFDKLNKP
jgi:hypothetical protein